MVAAALAVLGSVSSSAWADSYTIDFKTFSNTATADNPFDTKTLNFSVADADHQRSGGWQWRAAGAQTAQPHFRQRGERR